MQRILAHFILARWRLRVFLRSLIRCWFFLLPLNVKLFWCDHWVKIWNEYLFFFNFIFFKFLLNLIPVYFDFGLFLVFIFKLGYLKFRCRFCPSHMLFKMVQWEPFNENGQSKQCIWNFLLQLMVDNCRDMSVSIRKLMIQYFTEILIKYPTHQQVPCYWVRGVLPLLADQELKSQEKVLEVKYCNFLIFLLNKLLIDWLLGRYLWYLGFV